MKGDFRCDCPITSALDIVGDKWTLVIIKHILLEGRQTFKDFTESDEAIATNILSSRLKMLEDFKVITKDKLPGNKKTNIYRLTDKGISLTPLIVELALWSDAHIREFHSEMRSDSELDSMKTNKEETIRAIQENYKKKLTNTTIKKELE